MSAEYKELFKAFRFLVEIEDGGATVAAFSQFSGVRMEVQTIQARPGDDFRGVQEYIPVMTRFDPVTLSKGVVGDNEFLDWLFSAAAGTNSGPSGKNMRRTINVVALDEHGNRGVTWSLKDAMPIGYQLQPMDGGKSEVLSESLTFAITGMERITSQPQAVTPATPRAARVNNGKPRPRPAVEPRPARVNNGEPFPRSAPTPRPARFNNGLPRSQTGGGGGGQSAGE